MGKVSDKDPHQTAYLVQIRIRNRIMQIRQECLMTPFKEPPYSACGVNRIQRKIAS